MRFVLLTLLGFAIAPHLLSAKAWSEDSRWSTVAVSHPSDKAAPTPIGLRVVTYSPPILVKNGVWPTATPKPLWYDAFVALSTYNNLSYAEFASKCTETFISKGLLTERKFTKVKESYDRKKAIPAVQSIVWEIDAKWNGRNAIILISDTYEELKSLPQNNALLKPFSINAFEYSGGTWKNQTLSALDDLQYLPFVNLAALNDLSATNQAEVRNHMWWPKPKK